MLNGKKIVGIVLAAGESQRLGQPKQLVAYKGQTLVARAVQSLLTAGCEQVITVLGAYESEVREALANFKTSMVLNKSWTRGMGSSIAVACKSLQPDIDAVLISLCDQPLVPSTHLESLITAVATNEATMAATEYNDGRLGVPAIFGRSHFESLMQLDGDHGAKALIRNSDAIAIPLPYQQQFDIDTQADLERL